MKKYLPAVLISLTFFIAQIITLSDYGTASDLPFHFIRGQTHLNNLLTGKEKFARPNLPSPVFMGPNQRISSYVPNPWEGVTEVIRPISQLPNGDSLQKFYVDYQKLTGRRSIYQNSSWDMNYFFSSAGHPPASDILSAVVNRIFFEKLGLLSDVDGYNIYAVICGSLAVFLVYIFTLDLFGSQAAVFASLSFALFPFLFSESHFNIKDVPELAFFTGSLVSFYFWVKTQKKSLFLAFTLFFFLGLGTKANIVFLPFILGLWLLSIIKTRIFKNWFSWRLILYTAVFIILNVMLFLLIWPYLRVGILDKLQRTIIFYGEVGARDPLVQTITPFVLPFGINALGPILVVVTTPLIMLFFLTIGLASLLRSIPRSNQVVLVLAWFFVPILRVVFISTDIFGSIRQYSEFLPALAIASGVGATAVVQNLAATIRRSASYIFLPVAAGYFIYLVFILISYHPNENIYFNILAGGPTGAWSKKIMDWQTANGNIYRQTVSWLNLNAPQNTKLAFLDGSMFAISPLWLRRDITIGSYFSGFSQKGEFEISLVYPKPPNVFPYLYLDRFLEPVYEIKVDNVTIAKVWQNDPRYLKPAYRNQKTLAAPLQTYGRDSSGDFWQIDLERQYKLLSLTLQIPTENCNKRDGLFFFNDFFVSYWLDKNDEESQFLFPGQSASKIRFYPFNNTNSCFMKGRVKTVTVLQES